MHWEFQSNGEPVARMRLMWAMMNLTMHSHCAWIVCLKEAASLTLLRKSVSWVLMVGAISLVNAKLFKCRTMIVPEPLPKCLDCLITVLDFFLIAGHAVLVMHWPAGNSGLCNRSLLPGISRCLERTRNWFMLRSEHPRPMIIWMIWPWGRI